MHINWVYAIPIIIIVPIFGYLQYKFSKSCERIGYKRTFIERPYNHYNIYNAYEDCRGTVKEKDAAIAVRLYEWSYVIIIVLLATLECMKLCRL